MAELRRSKQKSREGQRDDNCEMTDTRNKVLVGVSSGQLGHGEGGIRNNLHLAKLDDRKIRESRRDSEWQELTV